MPVANDMCLGPAENGWVHLINKNNGLLSQNNILLSVRKCLLTWNSELEERADLLTYPLGSKDNWQCSLACGRCQPVEQLARAAYGSDCTMGLACH